MADPFLGEVKMVAINYPPKGWAVCDGQLLPINQNQALFSLLGTNYGGDGRITFGLPDLRGRTPVHASASLPLGQADGEESHTLTTAELPSHTHTLGAIQADASTKAPADAVPAYASEDAYSQQGDAVAMNQSALALAGGSQPHPNMQPYLVVNFIIALQGIFPSRN